MNPGTAHRDPEPLWREAAGRVLRRHRRDREERLVETAARAGISSQYLSEIERGRKDASSEVLAAVAGALDLDLRQLAVEVIRELDRPVPVRLRSVPTTATPIAPRAVYRGPVALAA
ncbi:helix-turn-helix domain-containing protein [Gordonia bronchialis]|uniref:helix-turn-helix domain-containing protein n=1 Tax=Gordonia bronchialis TaxID=2054 RepID=UPI00242F9727|nr:helix-turn-helix transcriptional regulator [Gordonia bronchialis]